MGKYLTLVLGLCLACDIALAENSSFDAIDANGDGGISIDEAQSDPGLLEVFGELDVNGDGALSLAEYSTIEASEGG